MSESLPSKVERFGQCFGAARPVWDRREGVRIDYDALESNPFDALMFLTMYAHERPQANPRYKFAHRMAVLRTIGVSGIMPDTNERFHHSFETDDNFALAVWQNFAQCLGEEDTKAVPNERYTKGAVRLILERLKEGSEPNVVRWLRSKKLGDAYYTLSRLGGGIGHKIAALFLRDIWYFVGEWPTYDNTRLFCTQPVDIWVERWARRCWPGIEWPSDREKSAKLIVECCGKDKINPILFNMGAWFVGSHFQRLCSFFQIPMLQRFDYIGALDIFDPALVNQGISNLERYEGNGQIFPLL